MNYLPYIIATIVVLHVYHRIGTLFIQQQKILDTLEALDEVVARLILDAEQAALLNQTRKVAANTDKMMDNVIRWRAHRRESGTSNDNGGDA